MRADAVVFALAIVVVACRGPGESGEPVAARPPAPAPELALEDRAADWGLDFVHFNGASGELYYPEMMGGGGALADLDGDGDLDLFLVQGGMLPPGRLLAAAREAPRHEPPLADRLYRNDLTVGPGGLAPVLVDVTAGLPPPPPGHGMGVAAGDVDGDGAVDLYVTRFGENRLLINRGDGRFEDRTAGAGAGEPRWSVPAVLWDLDADGRLDLWVGNYLDFTLATHRTCRDAAGAPDYCGPTAYRGVGDRLLRNLGGGRFEDVSLASGVGVPRGRTLGGLAADLDGDGRDELYVANDGEPNFLWTAAGGVRFGDRAALAGCAVGGDGLPQAGMGVEAADLDADGDLDLFLTHLTGESNVLYRNDGGGFGDASLASGLALPSWPLTGFGVKALDLDLDGDLDLATVNGAVRTIAEQATAGEPFPLRQPRQLFRNLGGGRFEEVTSSAGAELTRLAVGRGLAAGDVDLDGDAELLVVDNGGPARLLARPGAARGWISVAPVDAASGAPVPAVVRFDLTGHSVAVRAASDGSYASASEPRARIGLGRAPGTPPPPGTAPAASGGPAVSVRIAAPGRRPVELRGLAPNRDYRVPLRGAGGPG